MTTLTVAILTHSYFPYMGGAERQIQALAPRLHTRGVDIHVVTRKYKGLKSFEVIQDVPVHRIPIPGPKAIAAVFYIVGTVRLLQSLRPQVIHAFDLLSPTTAAVLAKLWLGTPIIAKVLRGGILGDVYKLHHRFWGRSRLSLLRRYVDAFVVISSEIDTELQNAGIDSNRREDLPNGVNTEKFAPVSKYEKNALRAQLGFSRDAFILVYAGRLEPEKRVEHLLTIWPKILEKHNNAILVIVGSGSEEARLRSQAGTAIHFYGYVDEILPYLQSADLFVLPSITEGMSNAMLEALSTGLPVVVTRVGAAMDVISERVNGLSVPPDDPQALLSGILEVMDSPSLQAQMGAAGREYVQEHYSLEDVAERLCSLYYRLANTK